MKRLRVDEPATVVTDWLMAVLAGIWAAALLLAATQRGPAGAATAVWGLGFVATAAAAALGGFVHGFQRAIGAARAQPIWRAALHFISLASAAMLAAAALASAAPGLRTAALVIAGLKLAAVTFLLVRRPEFRVALLDHALSLAGVLALQAEAWLTRGAASAPWIFGGIGLALVAAVTQAFRVAPHPRFNHNDLYHVIQTAALWLLYRGGLLLVVR